MVEKGCICDSKIGDGTNTDALERRRDLHKAWSKFLSSCWCINLKTRPDRYEETCKELHKAGLCLLARFYRPEPATVDDLKRIQFPKLDVPGYYGCWQSHRAVCQRHCFDGSLLSLVLEDDVQFDSQFLSPDNIRTMGSYVLNNCRADVFHLGHIAIYGGFPTHMLDQNLTVMRVRSSLMHAYIFTPHGADKFLNGAIFGSNGDVCVDFWLIHHMRQEAIYPQIATQRHSPSSNLNGTALNAPPEKGASHLEFYSRHHIWFDLFFCWIAPISVALLLPLLLIATFVALYFRRRDIFLWSLLFCAIILVLGTVVLYGRAHCCSSQKIK